MKKRKTVKSNKNLGKVDSKILEKYVFLKPQQTFLAPKYVKIERKNIENQTNILRIYVFYLFIFLGKFLYKLNRFVSSQVFEQFKKKKK